ncbi:MAG: hypothetical protein H6613_17615 [Ignavibacteriales bacterium]|nr:hypothetical protein [Ignavibacteriales bacterium]
MNFAPDDSLLYYGSLNTEPAPALVGDTVMITGVVMNSPYFNANPEDGEMLSAGAPAFYLQDINNPEWGGVLCRDPNLGSDVFAILDTGMIIQAPFEVVEYFTTTEIDLVSFDASNVIGQMIRPKPVLLTLDSLFETGTANPNYLAEKWEGVYVEFRNLTTSDPGIVGSGTFKVFDENQTSMVIYNKGMYYRSGYVPPTAGTSVTSIKGYIETRNGSQYGWFILNPVYEDDVVFGESAPNITNVERDKGVVGYGQEVSVSAKVVDEDNTAAIKKIELNYSVNDAPFVKVEMTITDLVDSIWSASIPAYNDSSLVRYYISAIDSNDFKSTSPSNPDNSYFYMVLDRPLTIKDVQYSPFGSGFSGYNNYEVTVSGIVSTDTTDIQGDGANIGPQVYLQDGSAPWSGIQIFGVEADNVRRGDKLTVTGIVNENFNVTRIGTLENGVTITSNGTGLQLPLPLVISTKDFGSAANNSLPAESYEGVLVTIENVKVLDDNADGDSGPVSNNYGEIYISDTSNVQMRLELQDGTHDYHNFWDASLEGKGIRIEAGHTFESITGILFYSFSNYKLVPRKNDDFVGHVTSVKTSEIIPEQFSLHQNYPNPFNPSTVIQFSIPNVNQNGKIINNVMLKVYDVLGRK